MNKKRVEKYVISKLGDLVNFINTTFDELISINQYINDMLINVLKPKTLYDLFYEAKDRIRMWKHIRKTRLMLNKFAPTVGYLHGYDFSRFVCINDDLIVNLDAHMFDHDYMVGISFGAHHISNCNYVNERRGRYMGTVPIYILFILTEYSNMGDVVEQIVRRYGYYWLIEPIKELKFKLVRPYEELGYKLVGEELYSYIGDVGSFIGNVEKWLEGPAASSRADYYSIFGFWMWKDLRLLIEPAYPRRASFYLTPSSAEVFTYADVISIVDVLISSLTYYMLVLGKLNEVLSRW